MKAKRCLMICIAAVLLMTASGCGMESRIQYEKAQSLLTQDKYVEAAEAFDALGSYEDASMLATYCRTVAAGENGDYDAACDGFIRLGDYKDSKMMRFYYSARKLEAEGLYPEAVEAYEQIRYFRDSSERAESCREGQLKQNPVQSEVESSSNIDTTIAMDTTLAAEGTTSQENGMYVYNIGSMTVDEIIAECEYYFQDIPYQGQSYEEYKQTMKVPPTSTADNSMVYSFMDQTDPYNYSYTPEHDAIYQIRVKGTREEMDGTIGFSDTYCSIEIQMYIMDYTRASVIYERLLSQMIEKGMECRESRNGTHWSASTSIALNEYSYTSETILSLNKYGDYYTLDIRYPFPKMN